MSREMDLLRRLAEGDNRGDFFISLELLKEVQELLAQPEQEPEPVEDRIARWHKLGYEQGRKSALNEQEPVAWRWGMNKRLIDEEEQTYLDRREIDTELRLKLLKKLSKCSEVIDCMGHTPSRQYLEEKIRLIIWEIIEMKSHDISYEPFKPDWVNYRQGVADSKRERLSGQEVIAKYKAIALDSPLYVPSYYAGFRDAEKAHGIGGE